MGSGGGGKTTTTIDVPPEFKPAFTALFNSAFGAARTAAGQEGFGTLPPPGGATELANRITGTAPGQSPFAPPAGFGGAENPFLQAFPAPSQNIFEVKPASHIPGHVEITPVGDTLNQLQAANPDAVNFGTTAGTSAAGIQPAPAGAAAPSPTAGTLAPTGGAFGTEPLAPTKAPAPTGGLSFSDPNFIPDPTTELGQLFAANPPAPTVAGATAPAPAPATTQAPAPTAAPTTQAAAPTTAPAPTTTAAPASIEQSQELQQQILALLTDQQSFLGGIGGGAQQTAELEQQIAAIFGNFNQNIAPIDAAAGATGIGDTSIPLAAGPPIIGQPFGEQFTAGTSPLEFESLEQREAIARQLQGIGNPLLELGNVTAQGGFLDPESNPFLVANIEAALRPITQQFTESTTPQFESQAIQSGAFKGSSARDLAFNQLASRFGQQVLDTGTGIAFDNFQRERVLQQNAGQLLDQGALLNQLTPELLAQTGLGQRELAQRPLDEALLQFQESITAPFRPLFPAASIIQGQDIGSIFSQTVPTPSPLSTGIVGALGGAQAGADIFSLLGGTSGTGGGLSALLGGLLGGAGGAFG